MAGDSTFPGLGSKNSSGGSTERGQLPYKELNIEEHMALQLCIALIRSDDCSYANRLGSDGKVIHGEERYAIDSVLAARFLLKNMKMSDKQIKERYEEINRLLKEKDENNEE